MKLEGVYSNLRLALPLLYQLLQEREPHQNISHQRMPTWLEHENFVGSVPYAAWYLIHDDVPAGAIYLTKQHEIGVGVLKMRRGRGLAKAAIAELMRLHGPARYLANINPANEASIAMFRALGFGGPVQVTLEKQA